MKNMFYILSYFVLKRQKAIRDCKLGKLAIAKSELKYMLSFILKSKIFNTTNIYHYLRFTIIYHLPMIKFCHFDFANKRK